MKKYNIIPSLLLIYLGVMSYIGYADYAAGKSTPLYYFGIIALTLVCIVLLRIFLKRQYDRRQNNKE